LRSGGCPIGKLPYVRDLGKAEERRSDPALSPAAITVLKAPDGFLNALDVSVDD